jgi:hypothetical protein
MSLLKLKDVFSSRKPTIEQLAEHELYECEVALLAALADLERASSNVDYLTNRVARLRTVKYKDITEVRISPQHVTTEDIARIKRTEPQLN